MLFLFNDNHPLTTTTGARFYVMPARKIPSLITTPAVTFEAVEVTREIDRQLHQTFVIVAELPSKNIHCIYASSETGATAEDDCADVMRQIERQTLRNLDPESAPVYVDLRGKWLSRREISLQPKSINARRNNGGSFWNYDDGEEPVEDAKGADYIERIPSENDDAFKARIVERFKPRPVTVRLIDDTDDDTEE